MFRRLEMELVDGGVDVSFAQQERHGAPAREEEIARG